MAQPQVQVVPVVGTSKKGQMPLAISDPACDDEAILRDLVSTYSVYS